MNHVSNQSNRTEETVQMHTMASEMSKDGPKKVLTPLESAVVGAAAGLVEVTVDQPLVTFKNELQSKSPSLEPKQSTFKWAATLSPKTLWSGWSANATGMAGVTAVQVAVKGAVENSLSNSGQRSLTEGEKFATAVAAGVLAAAVACPSELVMMSHQQRVKDYVEAAKKGAEAGSGKAPTYGSTTGDLYRRYGASGFGRGMVGTAVRDGGFTAAYVYGAGYFGDMLKPFCSSDKMCTLAGGVTAGLLAAAFTHPFDTWKTQKQSGVKTEFYPGGFKACVKKAFKETSRTHGSSAGVRAAVEEVFREPYRGFTPRATRVVMAVTLLTTLVHKFEQALQDSKG